MTALKIEDLKLCTTQLFVKETFDAWLLREANIVTFNSFSIDGRVRQGFYTDDELEENHVEEFSAWKIMRPICFFLIKGKKLPGSFQITLQLPPKGVTDFLNRAGLGLREEQIAGLYLNLRYENHVLHCITGTALNVFTLDKQAEHAWDDYVKEYLKRVGLAYTQE